MSLLTRIILGLTGGPRHDGPRVVSAVVPANGQSLVVTFDRNVSGGGPSYLIVTRNGVPEDSGGGGAGGAAITVFPGAGNFLATDVLTVSYSDTVIVDSFGIPASPFANFPVTNNSTQT